MSSLRLAMILSVALSGAPAALLAAADSPAVETWTQWRGPSRDGQIAGPTWPAKLSEDSLVPVWTTPLGPSYSGPIVAEDRVFVTETLDKTTEVVRALDRRTGRELWSHSWAGAISVPFYAEAWSNNAQGYMSSPVIIDGHAYLHLGNQRFTCIDLKTGTRLWTSESFGKYASLVAQGDRILALDERGILLLIKADPKGFQLIDQRKVAAEDTWAHLAVCGEEVFVRELRAMTALRWQSPKITAPLAVASAVE